MKPGERFNYLHHDGGWRLVEYVAFLHSSFCRVRDVHRGEWLDVRLRELIPIVPRSQWEDSGGDGIVRDAAAKFLASGA